MRQLALSFLFLTVSSLVFAAPAIEGDWATQPVQDGEIYDTTISFHNNRLTLSVVCETQGLFGPMSIDGQATVTVPVTYDDQTVVVSRSAKDNERTCTAAIDRGTMQYSISGETLTLVQPGKPAATFTRKND